jgi:hypothetical protein
VFWEAGYLLKAMIKADGDSYFAAREAFGTPDLWWRIGGCVLGLFLYLLGTPLTRLAAQGYSRDTLAISWVAASLAAMVAASLYAPDRLGAIFQAALEIGAAHPAAFTVGSACSKDSWSQHHGCFPKRAMDCRKRYLLCRVCCNLGPGVALDRSKALLLPRYP